MQINKNLSAVAILLFFCFTAFSQQSDPSVHFVESQYNFGKIKENDGEVKHKFSFINKGEEPLILTSVRAGGGFEVIQYTGSPVMPGDSGSVEIMFNPANMHGRFNRAITVTATGRPSAVTLRLLGDVIPGEKSLEELFPQQIGNLRLRSNHISFGRISPGLISNATMETLNLSDESLEISFGQIPAHIKMEAVPRKLSPGAKGLITAEWDGTLVDDWGVITSHARVLINGSSPGRDVIYLSANIQEDFSAMSDQEKAVAPVIDFEERVFDFGALRHGESIDHDFVFTNNGKSDLIIRTVRSGCGCTATEPQKRVLKPGETSSIKAVFNSRGFRGRQNKGITVISNDPANPSVLLRITGDVNTE